MYKLAYTERFKKAFNNLTNNEQTIAKMQAAILINEALNDLERNKEKVKLDSFIKGIIHNG